MGWKESQEKSVSDGRNILGKDQEDRENNELWELCLGIHLGCMLVIQGCGSGGTMIQAGDRTRTEAMGKGEENSLVH